MSVIAIKSSKLKSAPIRETKKELKEMLLEAGEDPRAYRVFYVYTEQRKKYNKDYKHAHRAAARAWYHRNKDVKNEPQFDDSVSEI